MGAGALLRVASAPTRNGQGPRHRWEIDKVELDQHGYIVASERRETNVAGVYAAGDVVQKEYRYLTTAAADGTIAALAAEKYIRDTLESEAQPAGLAGAR